MKKISQIAVGVCESRISTIFLEYTRGAIQDRFDISPSFLPSGFCNIGVTDSMTLTGLVRPCFQRCYSGPGNGVEMWEKKSVDRQEPKAVLTSEEVADELSLKIGTIRDLMRRKVLPAVKVGESWRTTRRALYDYLENQMRLCTKPK